MDVRAQFTADFGTDLAQHATQRTITRGNFLLQPGSHERSAYLVEEGAIRIFYLTEHEEHTIRFGYRGSMIADLTSFFNSGPAQFYFQAIRKTVVRVVPEADFTAWLRSDPNRAVAYNILLQGLLTEQVEREIDLLTSSPIERLKRVEARSPQLFQEVPSRYIASYLRMTPETLSRIRKS